MAPLHKGAMRQADEPSLLIRNAFWAAVVAHCPGALARLRAVAPSGAQAWAAAHGLTQNGAVPAWVVRDAARATAGNAPTAPQIEVRIALTVQVGETIQQFRRRAHRTLREEVRALVAPTSADTSRGQYARALQRRMSWAARYQVEGDPVNALVTRTDVDHNGRTVRRAIEQALVELGIDKRPSHAGRPRRNRSFSDIENDLYLALKLE